jgi:CBS domain-containing membrane protein
VVHFSWASRKTAYMHPLIRLLIPEQSSVSAAERIRSIAGAALGVFSTGLIVVTFLQDGTSVPGLIAPMGAAAVLLFATPSSPLAQPWPVIGGSLVSATVGVMVSRLVPDVSSAAALSIALAIGLMALFRCLHPPGGAIAMTAVVGGPAIHNLGYGFVVWPVAGNTVLLLTAAVVFNNLTGRPYPHSLKRSPVTVMPDGLHSRQIGFSADDLDEVLRDYDQVIDIDRNDLADILRRAELRSYGRRAHCGICGDVMSRDVIAVSPESSIKEALYLLRAHHIKALPVTNDVAEVIGIVTQTDLLDKASWRSGSPSIGIRQRLRLSLSKGRAPSGIVRDIMTSDVRTISPETTTAEAIVAFAEYGLHYLPVTGSDGRLVGIVSQSDVLVAMLVDQADAA